MDEEGSSVIRCLQDYLSEIKEDKCKEQVWGEVWGNTLTEEGNGATARSDKGWTAWLSLTHWKTQSFGHGFTCRPPSWAPHLSRGRLTSYA